MKRTLLAATGLAALALALPSTANATPEQDELLFDVMVNNGVYLYPNAVRAANAVCAAAWSGADLDDVTAEIYHGNYDWNWDQSELFVGAAILIYCPPAEYQSSSVRPKTTLA